jgi:hypothetical protein
MIETSDWKDAIVLNEEWATLRSRAKKRHRAVFSAMKLMVIETLRSPLWWSPRPSNHLLGRGLLLAECGFNATSFLQVAALSA